jgi:hypothetical protein
MPTLSLKKTLAAAAVAAAFAPGLAFADPTCAYVIGNVNGHTVTTPAVLVVVPSSDALSQPINVHVDPTTQTILGYSVTTPGANGGTYGSPVFVPGIAQNIPSLSFSIPDLDLGPSRCVDVGGVVVPAVPVHIPASQITLPGVGAEVGSIIVRIIGQGFTAPGRAFTFDGKTVVIPERDAGTPSVPVGTPAYTLTVDVNGAVTQAKYLPPNN